MAHRSFRKWTACAVFSVPLLLSSCVAAPLVRSYIYLPQPLPVHPDWGDLPAPEPILVRTEDGLALNGYRWPASTASHATLIFFHGNGGNRFSAAIMIAALRRPDAEIIVASYRGYSGNPGRPSEVGLYRDGAAFLNYARLGKPTRIYLFGYSLGSSVALRLAAEQQVNAVVTLGAFSSLASVAPKWAAPFLPDRFDNLATVRRLHLPYLLLHGAVDETVPVAEASRLARASTASPQIVILENAPHHISLRPIAPFIWDWLTRSAIAQPATPLLKADDRAH
jgi:uncharacterized protein